MIVDNVKLSNKNTPGGFMFDEPDMTKAYEFNFASEWLINPNNSEGVSIDVETNTIVITKVKPNTWFIRSNYGYTTDTERDTKFFGKEFKLSGLSANSDKMTSGKVVTGTYTAWGLVLSPCDKNGGFLCGWYPANMNIHMGSFKTFWGLWPGAANFGNRNDGTGVLYDYKPINSKPNGWDGGTFECGFAFYTGVEPEADGYIHFSTPLTISCILLSQFVDPTSKEAFTLALGKTKIYDKEKTFENLYMNHMLGFKYQNMIPDAVQPVGNNPATGIEDPENYAYVITTNKCGFYSSGKYKNTGQPISIPVATDLFDLIEREPVKFFICKQTDDTSNKNGLWYNVVKYFKEHPITGQFRATNLFAGSNINGSDYTDGDGYVDVHFNGPDMTLDGMFDHAGMGSREEGVEKVRIILDRGSIANARDLFRFTKYRLKEVQFINNDNPNEDICPKMMSGMFEYCGLPTFPKGLGFRNGENMMGLSESTCAIGYIAHGVAFKTFGNLKPDGTRYRVLVDPNCMYSFDTSYSPNDGPADALEEILVDLDMKFVNPLNGNQSAQTFNCKGVKKARIMNLNKGIWSLDGQHHVGSGVINGNLSGLDEESTNFLLSNVFDLRTNEGADFNKSEYTEGLSHSSLYLPASLKERASEAAIKIATERGWDVYFGGELVATPVNLKVTTSGTLTTITVKDQDSDWSVTKSNVSQPTIEIPANVNNIEVDYLIDACIDQTGNTTGVGVTNIQPIYAGKKINQVHFTCTLDRSSSEHSVVNNWAKGPC